VNNTNNDLEETMLKNKVLSNNLTFKTAFKATMGFYAAQFVATLLGLGVLGVSFVLIVLIVHFITK
jgi:hypothetical protein